MLQRYVSNFIRRLPQVVVLLASALCLLSRPAIAATQAPTHCVTVSESDVPSMFSNFNAALETQHPDKVARLFAVDALLIGHHAPKPRSGYMDIRDYYVYFLTGKPRAQVIQRTAHSGCGFLIDEGIIEWHFGDASRAPITTHYFMLHEYGPGGWRIAHYHDVTIEAPRPLVQARKVAVAGYLKRAPKRPASDRKQPDDGFYYKPGSFRDGVPVFD